MAVYAVFWQIIVRYPRSARGWVEFARAFADRGEWENCRAAARRVLAVKHCNAAIGDVLLQALGTLAEYKQLDDLAWREWLSEQSEALRSVPGAVTLQLRAGNANAATAATRLLVDPFPDRADAWLAAAKAAFEADDLPASYDYMRRALELDLRGALQTIIREFSYQFSVSVRETGKEDDLADWISEQSGSDDVNLIPPWPSSEITSRSAAATIGRNGKRSAIGVSFQSGKKRNGHDWQYIFVWISAAVRPLFDREHSCGGGVAS